MTTTSKEIRNVEWLIPAPVINKLWQVMFPRIMGRIWQENAGSIDCDTNPEECIEKIFGRTLKEHINFCVQSYRLVGKPVPKFIEERLAGLQESKNLIINAREKQEQLGFGPENVIFPGKIENRGPHFIFYKKLRSIINQLFLIVERIEEMPYVDADKKKGPVYEIRKKIRKLERKATRIFSQGEKLSNLFEEHNELKDAVRKGAFNALVPRDVDIELDVQGLSIFEKLVEFMNEYEGGDDPMKELEKLGDKIAEKWTPIFPEEMEVGIAYVGKCGDEEMARRVCFEMILTDKGILFPWPLKPHDRRDMYDAYVLREAGSQGIQIPGFALGQVSIPVSANTLGHADDINCDEDFVLGKDEIHLINEELLTSKMAGDYFNDRNEDTLCSSIERYLSARYKKEKKEKNSAEDKKDKKDAVDPDKYAWYISGTDFQRFQIALPRMMAALWGDNERYRRFRLLVREGVRGPEKRYARIRERIFEKEKALLAETDQKKRVDLEAKISEEYEKAVRLLGAIEYGHRRKIKNLAANVVTLDSLGIKLEGFRHVPGIDRVIEYLNETSEVFEQFHRDSAGEPNKNIDPAKALVENTRGELQKIKEYIKKDVDLKGDDAVKECINEAIEELKEMSDSLKKSCVEEVSLDTNTKKKIARDFKRYFESQTEFILPYHLKVEIFDGDLLQHMLVTNLGFIVPFPSRPDLNELYESWAAGESSVPSFTPTGSTA